MHKYRNFWPILLALLMVVLNGQAGFAQDATPEISDDQVNALARQLYCPVCENISLDVCPTTACSQWRELIREKMAAGWSDDQIKQYLVLQYGDRVLAEPPRQGLNWLVYILPPLIFLGGAILLAWVLRSMKKNAAEGMPPPPGAPAPDPYIKKMEDELKRRAD